MSAPIFDWMLLLQRQVLNFQQQALNMYGLGGPLARSNGRASAAARPARDVEVIPLGRETLNVGTRVVNQGTTRVRRFVIETPVEEKVPLRQERVIVERRRPVAVSSTGDTLTDKTIEMSDTVEVPVVWTSVELAEEVVVRREVKERVEAVRGVVRHDEVEIQEIGQAQREPAESHADARTAAKQDVAKLEAASPDKAQAVKPVESKLAAAGQDHKAGQEQKPVQDTRAASASGHEPARHAKT
ncbi:MAG TPA: YsnF/AvaK domain-containing protein [Acetobacteraceae bacterium]|nr:YsnF/AvaK domain-containing protein [Acetobacteraceae bacterium]